MLTTLRLVDFAIAEDLELQLGEGLTVITGETGAGKSILIGALGLLLGGRASDRVIRAGAERALLEACFDADADALARAAERGFEAEDGQLLVKRSIGRSRRAWINGSMATAADLRAVVGPMVDLSTQHQQNRLLDRRTHLELLDRMAGLLERREAYRARWQAWRDAAAERDAVRARLQAQAERGDYLRFCLEEISNAAPEAGETEALDAKARKLRAAEDLMRAAMGASGALSEEGGARDALAPWSRELERSAGDDAELAGLGERFDELLALIDDLAADLERYAQRVDLDPQSLAETEERLDLLIGLARKYGGDEAAMLARQAAMQAELDSASSDTSRLDALEAQLPALADEVAGLAAGLSEARRAAASEVGAAVEAVIGALGMDKAGFFAEVAPLEAPGPDGQDRVAFLLASNPGEPPHPLTEVASGGELSRVLLGLKRACADADPVATCVYDEVDAGLSGSTGVVLGRFLRELGARQQVLCISHLPQVAAAAHHHVHVSKRVVEAEGAARTVSHAAVLSQSQRLGELGRMLGGEAGDATARAHAEQLLAEQQR